MASRSGRQQVRQVRLAEHGGSVLVALCVALIVAALVIVITRLLHQARPAPPVSSVVSSDGDEPEARSPAFAPPEAPAAPERSVPSRRAATAQSAPADQNTPVSAASQGTLARLAQLDNSKPLTAEQAAAVKQDLHSLVAEGSAAIPAIQQFLRQNKDLALDEIKGGAAVGYGSLRSALFDALRQIGGSEAELALADVLRNTGDPAEIGLLAKHLEDVAPGQYRDEVLKAAREVLAQAAEQGTTARRADPSTPRMDVAPLFDLLQTRGDASVVPDLQKNSAQWMHYSLMAMADLPNGEGIPALIEQAQPSGSGAPPKDVFALQILAQVAAQYPDAATALLEQAKSGQIPDRAWRRIADSLAGEQYHFSKDLRTDGSAPARNTYHIEAGNENYYSFPLPPGDPSVPQRRALIDQLMAGTSNPAAAAALQQAKARLGR